MTPYYFLIGILDPKVTTKEVASNKATFSFTASEFSLPISYFIVSVNRLVGLNQKLCQDYADSREIRREYQENLFPNAHPPVLGRRNDSKVFEQEILNMEEYSFYTVTFTALYQAFLSRYERTISVPIETPPDGMIIM